MKLHAIKHKIMRFFGHRALGGDAPEREEVTTKVTKTVETKETHVKTTDAKDRSHQ